MMLEGSVTHGGGSCQLSLIEDRGPTKDSEWKVIKSYEGGCHAIVEQNLAAGATADNALQLDFVVPEKNSAWEIYFGLDVIESYWEL